MPRVPQPHRGDRITSAYGPKRYSRIGLRGLRLVRVIEEGSEQGAALGLENAVWLFGTSVLTVKRDVAMLRRQGCEVQRRGCPSPVRAGKRPGIGGDRG